MARNLRKKVVLCDGLSVPADWDITKAVPTGNVVEILIDDDETRPRTLDEAEAACDKPGRLSAADRTKARAIIQNQRKP